MRSTIVFGSRSTKRNTTAIAIGTATRREMPNSSDAAPMPANSVAVMPVLTKNSAVIAMNVVRRPKFSRIKPASPWPVTAPIRPAISCTTISDTVSATSVHSVA